MSKASHTDLPWGYNDIEAIHYSIPTFEIYGQNTIYWVAKVRNVLPLNSESAKCRANAELIVTAVNNHQKLITRLYNLVNAWDRRHQISLDDIEVTEAREILNTLKQ